MKIIYFFAKLFIVLVKISLPLIQEIIMSFLHDINNALNRFIEKRKLSPKRSLKNTYQTKIFNATGCARSHFTFATRY